MRRFALHFAAVPLLAAISFAQPPAPAPAAPVPAPAADDSGPPAPPPLTGKVLFSRDATTAPSPQPDDSQATASQAGDSLAVTDAERSALTFTSYDLDVHLTPTSAAISTHATITARNDGFQPLRRLILQITSTLRWDAISSRGVSGSGPLAPLTFASHLVDTDADHTGKMNEAVVSLPQPLPPGASISVTALYSGNIPPSAERLTRIGAPADQARETDWDSIAPADSNSQTGGTALRGFGNVLWYPVSAPPVFLGDGAKLFQAVGSAKLRQSAATVRLRLAVEYVGDPPDTAFFSGRREHLAAISDNANLPEAEAPGIATAVFEARPLGFRVPDLFIGSSPATVIGTQQNSDLIAAVTDHLDALHAYTAAAAMVEPLLTDWLGPQPLTPLTILDHPGQPFEDDALLVRPIGSADAATLAPSLAHSLTHAWIRSTRPWIDEGLAQFFTLLWTERTAGRAAALAELADAARSLAIAEPEVPVSAENADASFSVSSSVPDNSMAAPSTAEPQKSDSRPTPTPSVSSAGVSLAEATGEVFYRTKAAAVWWMLRDLVGDDPLKQALKAYRKDPQLDRDPKGLEETLEKTSHQDLGWFFNDWVYRDQGLPDLSIANITPSQLESRGGASAGWLVAVDVRNDGYAEANVPVTVRSATAIQTLRLRIRGRSSASTRFFFADTPEQVQVNDGSVPEEQSSIHTRSIVLPAH